VVIILTEQDEMVKLKNCPFCGTVPNQPIKTSSSDERSGYNFKVIISCECGASVVKNSKEGSGGWCIDNGEAMDECVVIWNGRV